MLQERFQHTCFTPNASLKGSFGSACRYAAPAERQCQASEGRLESVPVTAGSLPAVLIVAKLQV